MIGAKYPRVTINLQKLRHNIEQIMLKCHDQGIEIAGVIKGCSGIPECAAEFEKSGCRFIASSRLEQLAAVREHGMQAELMMIRVPMKSEAANVIRLTDISLNSELATLEMLNKEAGLQDRKHKVILMVDLGDLREGFWDRNELLTAALKVEHDFFNLELAGVGTNLGCYGAIAATPEKLEELVECAEMIESKIGRELQYISGGGTTSLPRVFNADMPERINLLRVGEGILLAKDLQDLWGFDMSEFYQDVFTLEAEVIEAREKPSYPVGEIMFDAFGSQPTYEDKGIRKRMLIGLGKADYAFPDLLIPREKGVEVVGASSDHTILDVTDAPQLFEVGKVIQFDLCYATMVYITNSPNIQRVYL